MEFQTLEPAEMERILREVSPVPESDFGSACPTDENQGMGRVRWGTGALLVALVAGAACGGDSDPVGAGTVVPMPADFAVAVGAGGGFAGAWSETSVGADGVVRTTSTGPEGSSGTAVGRLSADARREIWRELHARGFFAMRSEPGNMSTSLTVTAGGRTTSVAREVDAGPAEFEALARFVTGRFAAVRRAAAEALQVKVRFEPAPCALEVTVQNNGPRPLRIPGGRSTAAYMDQPFGLDLELRTADGEPFGPDPGAGGPALPVGEEHFTTLVPGAALTRCVEVGTWRREGAGRDAPRLARSPGRYLARVRWHVPAGVALDGAGNDAWLGATDVVELPLEVR